MTTIENQVDSLLQPEKLLSLVLTAVYFNVMDAILDPSGPAEKLTLFGPFGR